MIKKNIYIICALISILFTLKSQSQNGTIKGYKIEGDTVTFIFNVNDYPNIKYNGEPIKNVYVSGEFNNWAENQWRMNKINDSLYQLPKKLALFTSDFDWEFKFIVNSKHWAEPSSDFENITDARNWDGSPLMAYNLKLYSAFSTDYGNVKFKLKGYKNAKKVILSGTFNRWDETNFKMKKTDQGWEVTLQLQPDVYQYKFIVDGNWIEDPHNPSKTRNEFNGYNSIINIKKNIEFKLCDYPNAQKVILSGDFNNWSETKYIMKKVNGCWVYNKQLSGGKHHYKFIVDGNWMVDPANSVMEYDGEGHINSVCMVK